MKAGNEHRVSLTERALAILTEMEPLRDETGFVFPSTSRSRPISEMTMEAVLRRLKVKPATVHGFR